MGWHEEHREMVAERMAAKIKQNGEQHTREFLQWGGWAEKDVEYIIKRANAINKKADIQCP